MERITQAIEYLKRWKFVQPSYIATLERYVQSGDEAALASITPFGQQGSYWGYTLAEAMKRPTSAYYRPLVPLTELFIHHAPQMLPAVADALLLPGRHGVSVEVAKLLLRHDGKQFEPAVVAAFEREKDTWPRFRLG